MATFSTEKNAHTTSQQKPGRRSALKSLFLSLYVRVRDDERFVTDVVLFFEMDGRRRPQAMVEKKGKKIGACVRNCGLSLQSLGILVEQETATLVPIASYPSTFESVSNTLHRFGNVRMIFLLTGLFILARTNFSARKLICQLLPHRYAPS